MDKECEVFPWGWWINEAFAYCLLSGRLVVYFFMLLACVVVAFAVIDFFVVRLVSLAVLLMGDSNAGGEAGEVRADAV